jgi:hypothetical protein
LKSYGTSFKLKKKRVEIFLFSKEIIALCFFKTRLLHIPHTSFPPTRWLLRKRLMEFAKTIWCGQVA